MENTPHFVKPKQNTSNRPEKKIKMLRVRICETELNALVKFAEINQMPVSVLIRNLIDRAIHTPAPNSFFPSETH